MCAEILSSCHSAEVPWLLAGRMAEALPCQHSRITLDIFERTNPRPCCTGRWGDTCRVSCTLWSLTQFWSYAIYWMRNPHHLFFPTRICMVWCLWFVNSRPCSSKTCMPKHTWIHVSLGVASMLILIFAFGLSSTGGTVFSFYRWNVVRCTARVLGLSWWLQCHRDFCMVTVVANGASRWFHIFNRSGLELKWVLPAFLVHMYSNFVAWFPIWYDDL